jgi:hypothetical protein
VCQMHIILGFITLLLSQSSIKTTVFTELYYYLHLYALYTYVSQLNQMYTGREKLGNMKTSVIYAYILTGTFIMFVYLVSMKNTDQYCDSVFSNSHNVYFELFLNVFS